MTIDLNMVDTVLRGDSQDVWSAVVDRVHSICRAPVGDDVARTIRERENEVGELDDLISTSAWDLWSNFQSCVPRTSDELKAFWNRPHQGRAILILDGLSLREMPHLLSGAAKHGFNVVSDRATASEIPPETDPFANALGYPSRGSLKNAPVSQLFPGAKTTVTDMDWKSCAAAITPDPGWVVWHHIPDTRLHALENDGDALGRLSRELEVTFLDEDFWGLVSALTTGRSLMITSDHGYAVGGAFFEMPDGPTEFLRETFKARRSVEGHGDIGSSSPPLVLSFNTVRGPYRLALGRRKWKVPGGFPKLTHGGLTLLEVLCPLVEITK